MQVAVLGEMMLTYPQQLLFPRFQIQDPQCFHPSLTPEIVDSRPTSFEVGDCSLRHNKFVFDLYGKHENYQLILHSHQ